MSDGLWKFILGMENSFWEFTSGIPVGTGDVKRDRVTPPDLNRREAIPVRDRKL